MSPANLIKYFLWMLFQFSQYAQYARSQPSISWSSCDPYPGATVLPMECGTLAVPLDYTDDSSNATLPLELARITATKSPSKGSIIFNFGGPGAAGILDLASLGERLLGLTGGQYHLVTFVPRGTGNTLRFSCYPDDLTRAQANLQFPTIAGNSSNVALGELWANSRIFVETCQAAQNETGHLLGTAFVARDMLRVVDALGEDNMLRYWGISYGTILGATAAAMFPSRVDKLILDGVANPHEYYYDPEVELFTSTDEAFSEFCASCISSPSTCPLARNQTASELEAEIYSFLETLKYNPIPVPIPGQGGVVITYTLVKSYLYRQLYFSSLSPMIAALLNALITGDIEAITSFFAAMSSAPPPLDDEALYGIKCSDKIPRFSSLPEALPEIEARRSLSNFSDVADGIVVRCAQWQFEAKERYMGDFVVKTENPLLIIGNTFDPVTPLASAHNVSAGFEGSVVLEHGSYGHCSYLTQASLCTARAVRNYFANGTLPQPGTVCPIDVDPFSGTTGWAEVLMELDDNPE